MVETEEQLADRVRQDYVGPLSEQEIEFLRDVQGFIDFAIRNGLSFPMIVGNIGRDVNELLHGGFDLAAAKTKGFLPKVAGFSKMTSDDVGDSEESAA